LDSHSTYASGSAGDHDPSPGDRLDGAKGTQRGKAGHRQGSHAREICIVGQHSHQRNVDSA
jgi:hypothetical protein